MPHANQNTRQSLRGLHDRSELNKVRLRLYHANRRQMKLADETHANNVLLLELAQQEQELAQSHVTG